MCIPLPLWQFHKAQTMHMVMEILLIFQEITVMLHNYSSLRWLCSTFLQTFLAFASFTQLALTKNSLWFLYKFQSYNLGSLRWTRGKFMGWGGFFIYNINIIFLNYMEGGLWYQDDGGVKNHSARFLSPSTSKCCSFPLKGWIQKSAWSLFPPPWSLWLGLALHRGP